MSARARWDVISQWEDSWSDGVGTDCINWMRWDLLIACGWWNIARCCVCIGVDNCGVQTGMCTAAAASFDGLCSWSWGCFTKLICSTVWTDDVLCFFRSVGGPEPWQYPQPGGATLLQTRLGQTPSRRYRVSNRSHIDYCLLYIEKHVNSRVNFINRPQIKVLW